MLESSFCVPPGMQHDQSQVSALPITNWQHNHQQHGVIALTTTSTNSDSCGLQLPMATPMSSSHWGLHLTLMTNSWVRSFLCIYFQVTSRQSRSKRYLTSYMVSKCLNQDYKFSQHHAPLLDLTSLSVSEEKNRRMHSSRYSCWASRHTLLVKPNHLVDIWVTFPMSCVSHEPTVHSVWSSKSSICHGGDLHSMIHDRLPCSRHSMNAVILFFIHSFIYLRDRGEKQNFPITSISH